MSEETKYYGGTVTALGRNMIAKLLAGETLEFTRIVVGSGTMPEGVHPIDMTDLVNPVAEATTTIPEVKDGCVFLTVEYRNDMNGGLTEGFWLSEFGIYAKTEESEEILLYFATLGNSPQPVNAYKDNRIDIRRYPVTIELAVDADVQVTYNPGSFLTAEEAADLIGGMMRQAINDIVEMKTMSLTLPNVGWTPLDNDPQGYLFTYEVKNETITEAMVPNVVVNKTSQSIAAIANLCSVAETVNGGIRFWAKAQPEEEISGVLYLLERKTGHGQGSNGEGYVLPAATSTTLGGVMVLEGSGLKLDVEGRLSIDDATEEETEDLYEETTGIPSNGVVLSVPIADANTVGGVKIREGSGLMMNDGYLEIDPASPGEILPDESVVE